MYNMTLTNAPVLESENLILRGPEKRDADPMIAFLLDQDRAEGFGSSPNRGDAWRWFTLNVGHWHWHGYGYFTIETKQGDIAGISGIWNPEGWPEPEVGWVVFDGFEGRGIAYEAAMRARRWAYEHLGFTTLTSNIVPGNTRSIKLAERMGAKFERTYINVHMGEDMLFRHPPASEVLG
jgi:RimJ/RimL family protein N-acetyltransferase